MQCFPAAGFRGFLRRLPDFFKTPALLLLLLIAVPLRASAEEGIVFVAYNLRNYAPLIEPGQSKPRKSARSTRAVTEILAELRPDLLGVCEMGSAGQLEELRRQLAEHGLSYPYTERVEAADADRQLALLSRFPIVVRQSQADIPLDVNGSAERMRRGLLDVTVAPAEGKRLRILGLHLKSRLALRNENEALLRRKEAHYVRQHLDALFTTDPHTPLLLFGDLNDTKDQPAIKAILGAPGKENPLVPLALEDEHGDRWTHYWPVTDSYTRIDYIAVSRSLIPKVDRERSSLYRGADWREASDHRPLVVRFKPHAFLP